MISLIAALDSNFLIGDKDKLPWHYPKDLIFFKKKTLNQNVLAGLKTYQSLRKYYKSKAFPFKTFYVASSSVIDNYVSNIILVHDLIYFLKKYQYSKENIIVIGGGQIYKESLPYVTTLYLTHILRRYKGNIYFPYLDFNQYIMKEKKNIEELIFVTYERKRV
ncbi:dihydrofolate reductase [Candidatus Phytoplasma melaleucae]|uniref:dihydrofolate reductase n=1 Tax=Candidatus Phytoplasma melaleucae TaxID=2982630 RepID=A0ABT9DEA3_9MOLU|nr:dihydrofolate reductase ['Melaleuca sp.' phytoplasma]MDO8167916.1 dihydrofolate reductase ['Melaleuca sp.' phytoplasma]MDV3205176.1 dihydrofolate reductase [Weeping tea tree witches'-broom phytoplasma]